MPRRRQVPYVRAMTKTSKGRFRTAAESRGLIQDWEASGLGAERFAERRDFSASNLYLWRQPEARVTIWDASGQRVDGFGRPVRKKEHHGPRPIGGLTMKTSLSESLSRVAWADSYLLGWCVVRGETRLFLQIGLVKDHPDFRPFDQRREFGDYRLAVLRLADDAEGDLPGPETIPEWNATLGEFRDVAEIDQLHLADQRLEVAADDLKFSLTGESCLQVLESYLPDAFTGFLKEA